MTAKRDLPAGLLNLLESLTPSHLEPWRQAMLSELAVVEGPWTRLRWACGCTVTLAIESLRWSSARQYAEGRLQLNLIVGYQFIFSVVLAVILTWQLPQISESWKDAVPALILCFAAAAIPAVLGLGLATRDEAARIATIVFSVGHALLELEYVRRAATPHPAFTYARMAIDVLIIIALNCRTVRRAFEVSPIALHLMDDSVDDLRADHQE